MLSGNALHFVLFIILFFPSPFIPSTPSSTFTLSFRPSVPCAVFKCLCLGLTALKGIDGQGSFLWCHSQWRSRLRDQKHPCCLYVGARAEGLV